MNFLGFAFGYGFKDDLFLEPVGSTCLTSSSLTFDDIGVDESFGVEFPAALSSSLTGKSGIGDGVRNKILSSDSKSLTSKGSSAIGPCPLPDFLISQYLLVFDEFHLFLLPLFECRHQFL